MRHTAPVLIAAAVIATLAACAGSAPRQASLIQVSNGGCGASWHAPGPGPYTFRIYNAAAEEGDVELINPVSSAVYAEVEQLGPGTTAPMSLDLGSGRYAFRCLFEDFDPITGPAQTVAGHVNGSQGILPVTQNDLIRPDTEYHAYVTAGLAALATETTTLSTDIRHGDLSRAKQDWLTAHLQYERLGAAYGTFGTFDQEIDGRPDGLPAGVNDPGWTGFYRLEYGLWHGQTVHELTSVATTLDNDVQALQSQWPSMEIPYLDLGLRTHEILENALQFQLSGHDDYGSGTTLATAAASIAGTEELLTLLHPVLAARYRQLPAVYTWLDRLQADLNQYGDPNGRWFPVTALTTTARDQMDSACDQALEELAPIATIAEPRGV